MRTIEAKAVISAADKTGNVFDGLLKKIKGVDKAAHALGDIKAPKFTGNFNDEIKRLKLSEKELMEMRARRERLMQELRQGPVRAQHFFRAQQDWQDREVQHWRKLRAGIDDTAAAHKRWKTTMVGAAGAVAARGAALAGGAYAVMRTGRAGITAAATGQRESARDYLAGVSPEDSKRLEGASLEASRRFSSVDSSTMHSSLREAATSMRSTQKAVELKDTIGEMMTVLQSLKGKDKAVEEARRFFSALDVLGKNIDPKEVRELAQGYTQAVGVEGADFDLGKVLAMSKQLKSAGATVSNRFLMTTGVSLGRDMGDEKAGNAIAMAMQQEVQATKEAKAYGKEVGLRDKSGAFVDRALLQSDPDMWAWKHITSAMEKQKLNPEKNDDVNTFLNKAYSNQSARNLFSKLMTQGDQYKAQAEQFKRAPGLGAAASLPGRDPFVAYESVFAQLRTLAAQAPIMNAASAALNDLSGAIANLNKTIETGKLPDRRGKRWWDKVTQPVEDTNEQHRISGMEAGLRERMEKEKHGLSPDAMAKVRLQAFELQQGIEAARTQQEFKKAPLFTEAEKQAWQDQSDEMARERNRGNYGGKRSDAPFPATDPRKVGQTGFPEFGSNEGGAKVNVEGDVKGQVESTVKVEIDSSGLARVVEDMKRTVIDVVGKIRTLSANTNGPGSTGRSSPDAAAPGGTGLGGGGL